MSNLSHDTTVVCFRSLATEENKDFLRLTHKGYRKFLEIAKCKPKHEEDTRERKVHACKRMYHNPLSIKEETIVLCKLLQDDRVSLMTLIGRIISRDHTWEQAADACKPSRGELSFDPKFWWHLVFSKESS